MKLSIYKLHKSIYLLDLFSVQSFSSPQSSSEPSPLDRSYASVVIRCFGVSSGRGRVCSGRDEVFRCVQRS